VTGWKFDAVIAATQWAPVIMYLIAGPLWLAALWLVPAGIWTALAIFKFRDRRYFR
jgi:hypothetical protein